MNCNVLNRSTVYSANNGGGRNESIHCRVKRFAREIDVAITDDSTINGSR